MGVPPNGWFIHENLIDINNSLKNRVSVTFTSHVWFHYGFTIGFILISGSYGGFSSHGGNPKAGWFMRENPIKMDDYLGYPYSGNPQLVGTDTQRIPLYVYSCLLLYCFTYFYKVSSPKDHPCQSFH